MSRTVLITGAAGGIGVATTRRLLAAGYHVAISGRHEAQLQNLVSDLNQPDRVFPVAADATDYEAVKEAVGRTVERFGKLDVVIANAGFSTHDNLITGDPDRWREMVLVNVLGPALLVKAALPALRASRGRIMFLGSVAGFKNTPATCTRSPSGPRRANAWRERTAARPITLDSKLASPTGGLRP